ncbi:uncharacterized protein N7443_006533 [Penicillium atrosanguineum]|uniref:uncharacterized protein n=1 Tax=Penicillium atrosanguineum TaxID=1132637 RepID=UPI0023852661|nr:uncharacterized protein N7443_006533 [Penicillium atrosanguineum]KAJ5298413.1 hypothetical protein N7443_006533 [Penicillium atrosanguineum]
MLTPGKRLILCLDGTWVNSDQGFNRPTLDQPNATLQIPTNVTRAYRALKKRDSAGWTQIMYYHSGVGTSGGLADSLAGGVFGAGVSENIREAYSFIATNYEPGDEIVLVGFSRGAFTARSVAGLITEIGLLTSKGMEFLYPIFKDVENAKDPHYKDKFPTVPFSHKPRTPNNGREYKRRLEEDGLTRVYDPDGYPIKVRCVAVWDTVGSLGFSAIFWSQQAAMLMFNRHPGYRPRKETRNPTFYKRITLALDEDRTSFAPAIWERPAQCRTDLRQAWFCGAHSNVGGGLNDQELANITMAWMMDQLTSIGVAFEEDTIDRLFEESVRYYYHYRQEAQPATENTKRKRRTEWAIPSIYDAHRPVRPWGLGEIIDPVTGIYHLAGKTTRTPGMYRYTDPSTGRPTSEFLENTNERIHRSVRIRLSLEGLGYNDEEPYKCRALLKKGPWQLKRMRVVSRRQIEDNFGDEEIVEQDQDRWGWVYAGPKEDEPPETLMMEEPLGPFEDQLLRYSKGRAFYKALLAETER